MAARFVFALQPLLDARASVESEKRALFAASRHAVDECLRKLERLGEARNRWGEALAEAGGAGCSRDARFFDAQLRSLGACIEREHGRRAALEALCERARDEFAAARRERDVFERLKERARLAFELEAARREEAEIDEANARARRFAEPAAR